MDDNKIYERLYTAILEQRLMPNKKINEEEISEIFGVSRTVIRKVFLRLSLEGALELHKNRGAFIATLSRPQVVELYAARRMVEQGLIAAACKVAEKKDIKRLRDIIAVDNKSIETGERAAGIRLSGEFHLEIAKIAGNSLLHVFLRQLVIKTSIARACFEQRGVAPCSTHDHEELVDAIAARDVELARDLIVRHLEASESELKMPSPQEDGDLRAILS
jgi:DNA-binding GntR family transcriptional regulator